MQVTQVIFLPWVDGKCPHTRFGLGTASAASLVGFLSLSSQTWIR